MILLFRLCRYFFSMRLCVVRPLLVVWGEFSLDVFLEGRFDLVFRVGMARVGGEAQEEAYEQAYEEAHEEVGELVGELVVGDVGSLMPNAVFQSFWIDSGELVTGELVQMVVGSMGESVGMPHGLDCLGSGSEMSDIGEGSENVETRASRAETESSRLWSCLGSIASYSRDGLEQSLFRRGEEYTSWAIIVLPHV